MAKQTLSTTYKNDIMNSAMGGKRRYNLINNSDGTISLEDVTTYDQKGTDFTATDVNKITTAVNASADSSKIIDSKDSVLATTATGYMAGAKAVKEIFEQLNSNLNVKLEDIIGEKVHHAHNNGQTGWNILWGAESTRVYTTPSDGYYTVIGFNIGNVTIEVNGISYTGDYIVFHREKLTAGTLLKITDAKGSSGGGGGWNIYLKSC